MRKTKGFSLIEMLVVIAIIAVLVAIVIPVVSNSTEKAREATDLANVRSAYAVVCTAAMSEDKEATFERNPVYVEEGHYAACVKLSQKQAGWLMEEEELVVGGISAVSDANIRWFDEPVKDGDCTIVYQNGEVRLYWGRVKDYVSPLKEAAQKISTGSYCLNSTCAGNNTIKNVIKNITGDDFAEIKTWAAVRNNNSSSDNFNYVLSTIDITNLEPGTKIPAIFCDSSGKYSVGYTTVYAAPDGKSQNGAQSVDYNVISYDANGNYAYTYSGTKGTKNGAFDSSNMLTDSVSYSNKSSAKYAYDQLLKEYEKSIAENNNE